MQPKFPRTLRIQYCIIPRICQEAFRHCKTAIPTDRKKNPFLETIECQEAFDRLKKKLYFSSILTFPVPERAFILDTDCCNQTIGAVLSKNDGSEEKEITYCSETLNNAEQNSCVIRKKLLAIVKALKGFHKYLYEQKFSLHSVHGSTDNFSFHSSSREKFISKRKQVKIFDWYNAVVHYNNAT